MVSFVFVRSLITNSISTEAHPFHLKIEPAVVIFKHVAYFLLILLKLNMAHVIYANPARTDKALSAILERRMSLLQPTMR